ncbi:hypothetical protein KY342_05170 [Candidatus Woesearchaeota archaeon]|nr:hypothetical protein [Candidatus Woesearchaeota archaeon]
MLIIRTNYDIQTDYLYIWSNELINDAKKRGFKVTKIEGKYVTLKDVKGKIKARKPNFIFFNGHGSTKSFYDNNNKPFIDIDSSDIFEGKVTFARACDCLKELGPNAIKKGCYAFIGYKKKFWISRSHKRECHPLKDDVAKPAIECSNVIVKELLKGKSVNEAVQKSHMKSVDYILELIYSKEPLASASLQAVVTNDLALDFEGNPSATIC